MYSTRNIITVSLLLTTLAIIIISGCGGGGGGGSVITDPGLTPTTASTSTMSGYVYYTDTASASNKATTKKCVCSSTKITSAGYTPINNCTITIKVNGQKCHSDNEGHFQTNVTGNVSDYNCHIDPSTSTNASDITPFEQNLFSFVNSYLQTPVTGFNIRVWIDSGSILCKSTANAYCEVKLGNAVQSLPVQWSIDSNIGTIDQNGLITITGSNGATGKVTATVGGSSGSCDVTVAKTTNGTGSIITIVYYGDYNPYWGYNDGASGYISGATVKLVGTSFSGITDSNGTVRFDGITPGKYSLFISYNGKYNISDYTLMANEVKLCQRNINQLLHDGGPEIPTPVPTTVAVPTMTPTAIPTNLR